MSSRPEARLAPTAAQERVLALQRLAPGDAHCHVARVLRLRGPLVDVRLERAFAALVRRHASLRTSFDAGGAVRRVHATASFALERDVVVPASGESVDDAILRSAYDELRRPIDLAVAPLVRARLASIAPGDSVLCFTIHNVVCDGWSLGLLMRELAERYARDDDADALADDDALPAAATSTTEAEAVERWRARLARQPPPIAWPAKAAAADRDFDAHVHVAYPDEAHRSAIASLQRTAGVGPFAIHLAAFALALRDVGAGDDVLVATPVARRTAATWTTVGLHTDLVPVRVDLARCRTVRRAAARGARERGRGGRRGRAAVRDALRGARRSGGSVGPSAGRRGDQRDRGQAADPAALGRHRRRAPRHAARALGAGPLGVRS